MLTTRTTSGLLLSVALYLGVGCVALRDGSAIPSGAVAREVMPDEKGKKEGHYGPVGQDVKLVEYWIGDEKVGERQWALGGSLVYETGFRRGKQHGRESWWGDDGILVGRWGYVDGEPHGLLETWYEDGTKEHELLVERGQRQGRERWWAYDGQLWQETYWRDDVIHGTHTEWYEGGRKAQEFTYQHGARHGLSRWWRQDGSLKACIRYRHGMPGALSCPGAKMYSYVIADQDGETIGYGYLAIPAQLKEGRDNEGFFTFQLGNGLAGSDRRDVRALTRFLGQHAGGRMVLNHASEPKFIGETTTVLRLNPGTCDANIDFLVRDSSDGLTGLWLWGEFSGGYEGGQLYATPQTKEP